MKWARPEAAEPSPPPPAEAQREDEGWPGQKTEEQAVGKVEERGSRQIGLPGSHAETSRITPSDQAKTNADVAGQPRKKLLVLGGVVGGVIIAIVAVVIAVAQSSSGPSTQPAARPTFGTSSPASTTGAPSAKLTVAIKDLNFDPGTLQAKVGQTVTITNQDSVPHDWTDKGGAFHSPTLDPGQSFSYAFQKAGTYNVYCTIHPFMTQTVVVS